MKRLLIILGAVTLFSICNTTESGVVINAQQHENEAYNYSYDLATRISEAQNYEEFKAAYDEIKAYEEAFRTQIGGDSYYIFLEESNYILNEI